MTYALRDMIYAYKNGCLSRVELWLDDVNIQSQSAVPKERCGYLLLLFARCPAGHNGAALKEGRIPDDWCKSWMVINRPSCIKMCLIGRHIIIIVK